MADEAFRKFDDYYEGARTDIAHLVPDGAGRILDVGCGAGNTLDWLRRNGKGSWLGGVEINAGMAERAAAKVDRLWTGAIEDILAAPDGLASAEPFDVVLCLDVLEHLVDPWAVLHGLVARLAPGGTVIASIPNVRYYKVALGLLLRGQWTYEERGVLDATHLRFFTRETAVALVRGAGLDIVAIEPTVRLKPWKNKWILNKLSGGRLLDLYAFNYRIVGRKAA